MKILIVEDDARIHQALREALEDQRYVVEVAEDGELGWDYLLTGVFDVVVLDVMLPKLDGVSLCRRLRDRGDRTPVLMLTARDTSRDKVMSLDGGADDYVVKPFDLAELLARIRALVRRGAIAHTPILTWEHLHLDPRTCEVRYAQKHLTLTPKEYGLLELFLRHGSQVLSRAMILDHLWAFEDMPGEETVKVHLRSVRQKLKQAGAPSQLIETVYGLGYRLNPNL
ncbi:response regulator transcription factor [Spirulina major CS-329]|jgi:DNA-binding response OmpR family regulator|uniref:response regulator transcription factor n=1 Tax=Spirulina TaxID=1154 RepID=UPI00232BEA96|nr:MULTISPECIES: response regulator transcription factor [Spirulina]MDB9493102.1 response regulator transcription factor [Spirulina subsalsa CS-330]MDB9503094.1 response regulator transcription factor [Spirulina major CS-329]